jgi:TIR domain
MTMEDRKPSVFLSYHATAVKFADALKESIERDFVGLVTVFLASDKTSMPVGRQWLEELVEGLHASGVHIVLCNEESVARPWLNIELGAALVRGIPIIPLCHNGLTVDQLPMPLSENEGGVLTDPIAIEKVYRQIARLLSSDVPRVDFEKYGAELAALERAYRGEPRLTGALSVAERKEYIQNPRVLCITSQQFLKLGFQNQLQMIVDAFPKQLVHTVISSLADLRDVLAHESFDIVHIAAFVCPRSGDLFFSDVDQTTKGSLVEEVDFVTAGALADLLGMAHVRLVVVSSSESLALVTKLLDVTNVIAAAELVGAKQMAVWVKNFYETLTERSLGDAHRIASDMSHAPMRLYAQRCVPDFVFGASNHEATPSVRGEVTLSSTSSAMAARPGPSELTSAQ